ncbi:MAG: hypothetical protein WAJ85_06150 [Candidatus Baltobacteraceae bacterium]
MSKALLIGAAFAFLSAPAGAQTTPPSASAGMQATPQPGHHVMHLIKLPNGDYTVPLSELQGSGTTGKVTIHPQGLKTLVTVVVAGKPQRQHTFTLHEGSDCSRLGPPNNIALAPARTGEPSQTIVSLPISNLMTNDYIITAQDATSRQQYQEACAHL